MCPEESTNWGPRPGEGPTGRRARLPEVATRCGDSMRRAGLDLAQYNSAVSARDLEDLRRALGYEHWNLFGHSYGSRLALVAMRDAPQGIRSVVISGLYPPNVASWFNQPAWDFDVLHRVSAACAAQPACNAAFPEVEDTLWRTVDPLNRVPWTRQLSRRNRRVTPSPQPARPLRLDWRLLLELPRACRRSQCSSTRCGREMRPS
jgi:pimeloyl-ACP methyl ester carboxylesterase